MDDHGRLPPSADFRAGSNPADLPYTVAYDSFWAADVLAAAVMAFASERRVIFQYIHLIASTFGKDLRLLARNLVVIPKACLYKTVVRRAGCQHIHAHWATVSTSAAMLISRMSGVPFSFTGQPGTSLRHEAPGGEGCGSPVRAHVHRVQSTAPSGGCENRPGQGSRRLPWIASSDAFGEPSGCVEATPRAVDGRPLERKEGFLDLIEALAIVRDRGSDFRLRIIAGEGSSLYERRVREESQLGA